MVGRQHFELKLFDGKRCVKLLFLSSNKCYSFIFIH